MRRNKICEYCKKVFYCPVGIGIGVWSKRRFCSKSCSTTVTCRGQKRRLGTKHSEETKRKMSKPRSKEGRKNMSIAALKNPRPREYFQKINLIGLKKQQDSKKPTLIEKKVYDELKKRGLLFETQKIINGRFLVDAYIPNLNLIIEADGDYWHSLERVQKKDKAENAYLTKCGFNLVRWREADINTDVKSLFNRIGLN